MHYLEMGIYEHQSSCGKMVSRERNKELIKRVYNWLGAKLDTQAFYEQSGVDEVIRHGRFDSAYTVFEFGCGTGRLAHQLLAEYLSSDCLYSAVDISPKMVAITRARLEPWEDRTSISVSTGSVELDYADSSFDRFICIYVIDLLSDADAFRLIEDAHRILRPDGLLCLVSITPGITLFSRMLMSILQFINKLHPVLTGGCRPVRLLRFIPEEKWYIDYHHVLSRYGVAIEIVIARRR